MKPAIWQFSHIWNDSLLTVDTRELVARDYMWASEIGSAYVDRYLKMQAIKYSNPPNSRSMRKFQAGHLWEWIVGFVLSRAGILQERQEKVLGMVPGCLAVSGKMDFIAGGNPDWARAEREVKNLALPEFLYHASLQIIGQLHSRYGNQFLEETVFECKSNGSFVFDRIEATNRPLPHNAAQTYFYCVQKDMPGKLAYICRDDCRIKEFRIGVLDRDYAEFYQKDCEQMTYYWQRKIQPPREQELLFDEDGFRFRTNWKVEYSNYLTLLYGYATPQEYRDRYDKVCAQYNRVFRRCVDCATMTKQNMEVIREARVIFKLWDQWVEQAKIAKAKGLITEEVAEEVE